MDKHLYFNGPCVESLVFVLVTAFIFSSQVYNFEGPVPSQLLALLGDALT